MKKFKMLATLVGCLCIAILLMPIHANAADIRTVTDEDSLREALEAGESVKLANDITITEKSQKYGRNTGITIDGDGSITIDGDGKYSIITSSVKTILDVFTENGITVNLKNITLVNDYLGARCINTRTGKVTLNLEGVTLNTESSIRADQPITVGSYYEKADMNTIKLVNSSIKAGAQSYAITLFNPVNLTIDNSSITGWNALNMKGAVSADGTSTGGFGTTGSIINLINGSKLSGVNINDDADNNSFATIIFEDGDIKVNVKDSTIEASSTNDAYQVLMGIPKGITVEENIEVNISGNSNINVDPKGGINGNDNVKIVINEGVSSNLEIPTNFIADGYVTIVENGRYLVTEKYVADIPTINTTEEVKEVEVGVKESEEIQEILLDSLKSDNDLTTKIGDNGVVVGIEISNLKEETIDNKIADAIKEKVGNATIASFFDITIAIKNANDNSLIDNLTQLNKEIELMILLPEELKNTDKNINRTYYVVRQHGDKIELLDARLSSDGKSLVFKSDKFSTYALAYEDNKVEDDQASTDNAKNPATGDNIIAYMLFAVLALVGVVVSGLTIKRKLFN